MNFGDCGDTDCVRDFYRVMLGKNSVYAPQCFAGNCIGADSGIAEDLSGKLPDEWREFNKKFVPVFLAGHPEKTKIGAGLACGALWTVARGIRNGDVVICPDGKGTYHVGEITGHYQYVSGDFLPHRRPVRWYAQTIDRQEMSDALKNSAGSIGTVSDVSRYRDELEKLVGGAFAPVIVANDPSVEDPAAFVLEKHLEDFLVQNWAQTDLGKEYDIYEEDGEAVGQQYPTDTGLIDILAISKDQKRLLIVELKKGRASDAVVGQVLRYMGFVQGELAEVGQTVAGVIIALEDDQRIRRALAIVPAISFYRYQVNFKLVKGQP